MIKVKIPYTIIKEKELTLTTREYCEYHADSMKLRKSLANENNVSVNKIILDESYLNIIEGELDFNNLDE